MRFSQALTVLSGTFLLLSPMYAYGQVDTTAPVLVNLTVSPVVFDATVADVPIEICGRVKDDLSGGVGLQATLVSFDRSFGRGTGIGDPGSQLEVTICLVITIPRFGPLGGYGIRIGISDKVGNGRFYSHPAIANNTNPPSLDLCAAGFVCEIENIDFSSLEDSDGDLVVDLADNCPNDPNPGQEDSDLDLIGDVCDPFPDDRDNEQAQCEADLGQCLVDLAACPNPSDLAQCEADLSTCDANLLAANTDLAQCTTDLTVTEGWLTQCNANLVQATSDLAVCNDTISQLQSDLAQAQGRITQLEGEVAQLQLDLDACLNPPPACNDGIDNDGDGRIDFPDDKQCRSAFQASESSPRF